MTVERVDMDISDYVDLDGDDAPSAPSDRGAIYSKLRQELATAPETPVVWMDVPGRPTISIGYETAIDYDTLKLFLKKNNRKDFNPVLFAHQVMSYMCRGVRYQGKDMTDEDGQPMVLATMMPDKSVGEIISWVYGSDGHIIATVQKLMEASGYGGTDDDDSPFGI